MIRLFVFLALMAVGLVMILPAQSASAASSGSVSVTVQVLPPSPADEAHSDADVVIQELPRLILKVSEFVHETTTKSAGSRYYLAES